MKNRSRLRKQTPWDDKTELTATQEYIQMHYAVRYEDCHTKLKDDGKANMLNSYVPTKCPFCASESFVHKEYDAIGILRFRCKCGKYFKPTTGTIFD